tara:strand:- start:359 stop:859 length:501 start_codon:yes stop_codon:yes gene_type:complete
MIKAQHFENYIVRPTLALLGTVNPKLSSEASVNLLLGTAAQETDISYWLRQQGGPGLGAFSIEPATRDDIVNRYLQRPENSELYAKIQMLVRRGYYIDTEEELITNAMLGCAIARIRYWYVPEALPDHDDLLALGEYWDKHYNCNEEFGTPQEFVESWNKFVKRDL